MLKTHARNFTISALLVPIALALATLIANEAQTLIGLDLERTALALFLLPFLLATAAVIAALIRLEAAKIGGELGQALGGLAGLFDPEPEAPDNLPGILPPAPSSPPPPPAP